MKRLLVFGAFFVLAVPASAARLPIVASQDWWPVYSPNGNEIAFTRVSGRTMTLEVVDLGTKRTFRIAANQGQLAPSWSSDGRLAFSLGSKIYTANADGNGRKQFTSEGHAYAPAWRPNSSDIAYLTTVGAQNTDLWVDGTLWARDAIGNPAWSHDGTQLAFQRDDGIYITTGPGAERRVASVANPFAPAWSPDGSEIAYHAKKRIWVVPADGSGSPKAVSAPFSILSTPSWSRQGDALTYMGSVSVWITYLDTGKTSRLIGGATGGAAFSPVSDTVAFSGARPTCRGHVSIRIYYDNKFNGPVTGSCEIVGTPRADVIEGTGAGGDVILAGAGNDVVHVRNGRRDTVDCGPGRDVVWADRSDGLRNCETVTSRSTVARVACSCCARDYEKMFGRKTAEREARRFRKHGLRGSAKALATLAGDVHGESVLEIGGGIGAIEIALLDSGATRATNVELAATYEDAARTLLAERGMSERVDRHLGDFVATADAIEPHDVVVMHRVVCCYPDVDALVRTAAERAGRRLVLTYPQERAIVRAAFRAGNALMRLRGSTFRAYVHPVRHIEAAAAAHGLRPTARRRDGLVWESVALSRR